MENIVIDVLFPYYGDVGMMKKAVFSVLKQTYPNWRLKVFDDGYPSSEPQRFFRELIEKEQANNQVSRISYEKNKANLGAGGNYQKALNQAQAEFCVFMGADDVMLPDFLAKFVAKISEIGKNIDIYHPNVKIIDENGQEYCPLVDKVKRMIMPKNSGKFIGSDIAKSYVNGWHYFPAIIWKTASAKKYGFNQNYQVVQDVNLALDIIQNDGIFYFDKEHTTFAYRRHSKSDSSVKALNGARFAEEYRFYQEKAQQFHRLNWRDSEKMAKMHLFSRLNALHLLPKALFSKEGSSIKLLKHVFS